MLGRSVISCFFDGKPCDQRDMTSFYVVGLELCVKFNGYYFESRFQATKKVDVNTGTGLNVELFA